MNHPRVLHTERATRLHSLRSEEDDSRALARCGINVNITPLEPEWEGNLTIEISNTAPLPVRIYVNEGIAQLLFIKGVFLCQTSYEDKNGKYQNQVGITLPKVEQ